jgi:GAF domain-containing protein
MAVSSRDRSRLQAELVLLAPDVPPLERLCRGAAELLGVSGAAVILMSGPEPGALVTGSSVGTAAIEELQFALGEGPCFQAFQTGRPVLEPDLLAESRWPVFSGQAVDGGARAVFAMPLQLGAIRLGVLYLYRDRPGMLTTDQLADAFGLAAIATDLVLELQSHAAGSELGPELASDWEHRGAVHQATGMVAAQVDSSLADGLARLRGHAYGNERSLYNVAVDVLAGRLRFER